VIVVVVGVVGMVRSRRAGTAPVVARTTGAEDDGLGGVEGTGGMPVVTEQAKHQSSPGGTTVKGTAMPAIISARPPMPAAHDTTVERLVRSVRRPRSGI
jgi:hypothetical protein